MQQHPAPIRVAHLSLFHRGTLPVAANSCLDLGGAVVDIGGGVQRFTEFRVQGRRGRGPRTRAFVVPAVSQALHYGKLS